MDTYEHPRVGHTIRTTTLALSSFLGLLLLGLSSVCGCDAGTGYMPPSGTPGSAGDRSGSGGVSGGGGAGEGGNLGGAGNGGDSGGAGGDSRGTGGARAGGTGGAGTGAGGRIVTGAGGSPVTGAGGSTGSTGGATGSRWGTPVSGGPTGTGVTATVTVDPTRTVGAVGSDFVGFSTEKTAITNASLINSNADLIALYKLLGKPSLRLGANDVDNCNWAGPGPAPTQPSGAPFTKMITTGMVDNLCGFLAQTGIKVIYGVNYVSNNVTASAAEAAYVMGKCPSSVYAFEIGNEIEKNGAWTSQQTRYQTFADAILSNAGALLAGPGATDGGYLSLTVPYANSEVPKYGSKIVALTQHMYVAGSGTSGATVAALQTTAKADPIGTAVNGAAVQNNVPNKWRFGEINTFSQHGQPGVSDTLVSGLWAVDVMGLSAERGASGVNFHGGETGMDGTKPFTYEPIQMASGRVTQVQPEYYAMLLFSQAGPGKVLAKTVNTTNQNFTAYAIKADAGFTSVILDNRNASNGVTATINLGAAVGSASAIYLQGTPAGSLTATAGNVTLAGASVQTSGAWNRGAPYVQTTSGNTVSVFVPPATAALVRVLP